MTKENFNCRKCNKETKWEDTVWCNSCGVNYCKECATGELRVDTDIILFDVSDEDGDVGIIAEECANCY